MLDLLILLMTFSLVKLELTRALHNLQTGVLEWYADWERP